MSYICKTVSTTILSKILVKFVLLSNFFSCTDLVCVTTPPTMENSTACFTTSSSLERTATMMKALATSSTRNAGC